MPTITRDGRTLAYHDTPARGPGDAGPTLVLLHGIANSHGSWEDLVGPLSATHRVVRLDFRGHGGSTRTPGRYAVADYADDVVGLVEALGLAPAVLVGHSLGGLTAAWLATRRPELVRAVVLVDPPLFTTGPADVAGAPFPALFAKRQADARAWQQAGTPVAEVAAALAAEPSIRGGTNADHWSGPVLLRLAEARLAHDPDLLDPALEGRLAPDWDPDAVRIACPVLVVAADPALGAALTPAHAERLTRLAPGAEVRTYEGASHMLHIDAPDRVAADLLAFVDALDGPVSG